MVKMVNRDSKVSKVSQANKGIQGIQGEQGERGPKGDKGNDGYTPIKDIDYFDGEQGIQGEQGTQGIQGAAGQDGLTTSVNNITQVDGNITITQDDIPSGNTNKVFTATEQDRLAGLDNELDMRLDSYMLANGGLLGSYTEVCSSLNGTTPTISLEDSNIFTHTLSGNTTYTMPLESTQNEAAISFTLIITQPSTPYAITFDYVLWQGGAIPDMSTGGKAYVLTFLSAGFGNPWLGMFGGEF